MKEIYPIYLSSYEAKNLVEKHASREFSEGKYYSSAQYSYDASIASDGSVRLAAYYTFDDGYCSGSGRVFEKVVRPFNDEQLAIKRINAIMDIAEQEYLAIEEEKKQRAIMKIAVKMFPDIMQNVKERE